jgi:hypothetical protein
VTEPLLVLNGEGCDISKPVNNVAFLDSCCSTYAPPGYSLASVTVVGNPAVKDAQLEELVRAHLGEWFGESPLLLKFTTLDMIDFCSKSLYFCTALRC